jgi:hypothetical protein
MGSCSRPCGSEGKGGQRRRTAAERLDERFNVLLRLGQFRAESDRHAAERRIGRNLNQNRSRCATGTTAAQRTGGAASGPSSGCAPCAFLASSNVAPTTLSGASSRSDTCGRACTRLTGLDWLRKPRSLCV